jgi:hypothetical protein
MMTLRLEGQEATWHLPLVIPDMANATIGPIGLGEQWGLRVVQGSASLPRAAPRYGCRTASRF